MNYRSSDGHVNCVVFTISRQHHKQQQFIFVFFNAFPDQSLNSPFMFGMLFFLYN